MGVARYAIEPHGRGSIHSDGVMDAWLTWGWVMVERLCVRGFRSMVVVLCGVLLSGFAKAPAPLLFGQSDVARRLGDLGHEICWMGSVGAKQWLVGLYVPFQGALSDWDDETRLVLYRETSVGVYERVQFVSKAGDSLPGRASAVALLDLDGDGEGEILAQGQPMGMRRRVTFQIYRRDRPDARFMKVYERCDSDLTWEWDIRRSRITLARRDRTGAWHRQSLRMRADGLVDESNDA